VEKAIEDAILELNHRVRDESSRLGNSGKMGSTVTMAVVAGDSVHVGHMGDSVAFLARKGNLARITRDHSIVGMLVDMGDVRAEDAGSHPMRGRLSRYIGMGGNARADTCTFPFPENHRLLLCTDGLTADVPDEEIGAILDASESPSSAVKALIAAARAAGAHDNVTVVVVDRVPY
jgi:protein phosphatase